MLVGPCCVRTQLKIAQHLVCAAALLALGWLLWKTGGDFAQTGETTAQLKIAKAPFIYGMGVLCAVTGIVHLVLMFQKPHDRFEPAHGEGTAL